MDNQKLSARLSAPPDCAECNGKGYAELIDGWERPCDACRGEGFVMDKAEQPTITQADELLREIFLHGHSEGWTGNQTRRDVQHVDAEKGWSLYVSNGALEKTKARHRTASLAAQEVDSGMSGDAVERAEWFWTNLPTGRKWTGLATHEKALVCHQIARITPSLAAQDGLVAEIERQEGLVKTYRGAQLRAEEKLCREQANAQGWKRRAEILESKLAALSAIKEQHHD